MIVYKNVDGVNFKCSEFAWDLFDDVVVRKFNVTTCIDIMKDCIKTAYDLLLRAGYKKVFIPKIFIAETEEVNAFALYGREIIITSGLIFKAADLLAKRYNNMVLKKYDICNSLSHENVMSGLRVYFWRFIVLHELYHIWNGHYSWKLNYRTNRSGVVIHRLMCEKIDDLIEMENTFDSIKNYTYQTNQQKLTQQALEFDADSSAVCMLINLLMYDVDSKKVTDKKEYLKNELALIFGAVVTAFYMFNEEDTSISFETLNKVNLTERTHPIPSLRFLYLEDIAGAMLSCYYEDDEVQELQTEWNKIVCDVEPDYNGVVDLGQVFYFTAYTDKVQRHFSKIKLRMRDIYYTLSKYIICNHAEKLTDEDIEFIPEFVWFTDDGVSKRGWINPATGKNTAIKAKQQPV